MLSEDLLEDLKKLHEWVQTVYPDDLALKYKIENLINKHLKL